MENKMQMIDVLKRLAELDSANPNVEKIAMTNEQSLATVTNIEGEQINECGPMGMMPSMGGMAPRTPASFSINASADSGDEVASMLTQIMNLAGVKPAAEEPAMIKHHEVALEPAHPADLDTGDIGKAISIVDKMNGPAAAPGGDDDMPANEPGAPEGEESPVADMADEVRGMADELSNKREEIINDEEQKETYANSPDPQIEPHKYGDDQVKPKQQGFPHRQGDNPYEPTVESVAAKLLQDYQNFIKG